MLFPGTLFTILDSKRAIFLYCSFPLAVYFVVTSSITRQSLFLCEKGSLYSFILQSLNPSKSEYISPGVSVPDIIMVEKALLITGFVIMLGSRHLYWSIRLCSFLVIVLQNP